MRRTTLTLLFLLTALVAFPATTAWACSCAIQTAEEFVTHTDGPVFVGTLVGREPAGAGGFAGETQALWTFEVERVFAGELPAEVSFLAVDDGGNCGLMLEPGTRVGISLHPDGNGDWTSSGCATHDPDALLAVAPGEPPAPAATSSSDPASSARTNSDPPWIALAATVGLSLAVLLGTVAFVRRKTTP
ncbi:MAG: hypothetical protein R3343_11295 [Nitriliruptorales bacterium]|nr:hypothetical protein [Nitriliruptorales bacterium]